MYYVDIANKKGEKTMPKKKQKKKGKKKKAR